jgi:FeS assembly SUF system regulator
VLKISKLADYGVVLLTTMANAEEVREPHNARDLADTTRLPLPMVSKVLKALSKAGLLDSHRGIKGGYSLAKPADEINAVEIIRALDGPIAITSCVDSGSLNATCGIMSSCSLQSFWQLVNNAIVDSLEKITLANLLQPGQKGIFSDSYDVTTSTKEMTDY